MLKIEPILGCGLRFAKGEIETPCGKIVSRWIIEEKRFMISVSVPVGTCCELKMPDGSSKILESGKHHLSCER